ncbi:DUF3726 domain-containing protein [Pelagovum sp. HNIBRBA483]|uniref:DUF3726 domain-containing protein n=1 Tax=Pelagovum sp. HNIBRBA483 TaxID=3233341 RepID=UPI0034A4132F
MDLSLGEIEALARKAARGAGFSWGVADEAARDIRWLEHHGFSAAGVLAALLIDNEAPDGKAPLPPNLFGQRIQPAEDGMLCPITTARAIADRPAIFDSQIDIGPIQWPLLLLPAVARAAQTLGRPLTLSWFGFTAAARPNGDIAWSGLRRRVSNSDHVKITPSDDPSLVDLSEQASRCAVSYDTYEQLNAFAARTYAPATEESRAKGAGAGTTDND